MRLDLVAPAGPVTVDAGEGRRIIAGQAVPWNVTARVASGQLVRFEPGSVTLAGTTVTRDHDVTRPFGVVASEASTASGLAVSTRVSRTPAGDEALTLAADGVLRHWSVGVEPTAYRLDETAPGAPGDPVYVVSAASAVELSLLARGAFGTDAAVTHVAASHHGGSAMSDAPTPTPDPVPVPVPTPDPPAVPDPAPPAVTAAAPAVIVPTATGVRVGAEAFPYSFAGHGPSLVRDVVLASDGDPDAAARVLRARRMLADPRAVERGSVVMAAAARRYVLNAAAAGPGDTTDTAAIVPPGYRGDLYVPMVAFEAPVWSSAQKMPISDFTPFTIPTETARTGLSGSPADEITPIAPGTIDAVGIVVTPQHVMGTYQFSRDLALSSNPAIDVIAMNALDESWLADVEARAAAYVIATGHRTVNGIGVYTDGQTYVKGLRTGMAKSRIARHKGLSVLIAGNAEYLLAIDADDAAKRPLLPWVGGGVTNAFGVTGDAVEMANIYGRPLVPQAVGIADGNTVGITAGDFVAFATPVWSFRFEATPSGGQMNPLVLQLTKYSGVAFWTRRVLGVRLFTSATPSREAPDDTAGGEPAGDEEAASSGRKGK
jgi:hypothetical protein